MRRLKLEQGACLDGLIKEQGPACLNSRRASGKDVLAVTENPILPGSGWRGDRPR
jgi:hypothetical protein